jgi:rfaE bifunctional protein nucleotidyltransferase chain/domain
MARPLVFTNGCFDILHRGHVTYLAQAAALGVSMVVAFNSDASVKRLGKGDDRPVNTLADRLAVMAALGCVALVTWFDEDTPLQRILDCQPEILVKGGDWPVEKIVGCTEVRGWGGTVHSIPYKTTCVPSSTTRLLGILKKAVAEPALRNMATKIFSRQNAISELSRGNQRFAADEVRGIEQIEFQPGIGAHSASAGNVRLILETVLDDDAPEILAQLLDFDPVNVRHIGHIEELHRNQHHPFVQHLVVHQVVQHGMRHARRVGIEEHRGAGDPGRHRLEPPATR